MSIRIAVAALAALLGLQACAARTSPSLTEEQRGRLGRIGIVVVETPPKSAVDAPTPLGGLGGGLAGAAKGVGVGVLSGAGCFLTVGYVWPLCVSAVMTPYWIGRGTVEGARNAVPETERRAAAAAIAAALSEADTRGIACHVAKAGRRRSATVGVTRDRTAVEGFDTVAEITPIRLALERRPSPATGETLKLSVPDVDPILELVAEVRVRVVATSSGAVLLERSHVRRSQHDRRFTEWARDDAAELRQEAEVVLDALAFDVADELFATPRALPAPSAAPAQSPCAVAPPR